MLSPSCQPYTVINPLAKGAADPRARSFLHLIEKVIPDLVRLNCAPKWLLVENVAGFEVRIMLYIITGVTQGLFKSSETRQLLVRTLDLNGYSVIELVLTPLQFGIPNSRLRYYLLAKARPSTFADVTSKKNSSIWKHIPGHGEPWVDNRNNTDFTSILQLRHYLDVDSEFLAHHPNRVPDHVLQKWGRLFDIVLPSSRRTCCFTRGNHDLPSFRPRSNWTLFQQVIPEWSSVQVQSSK